MNIEKARDIRALPLPEAPAGVLGVEELDRAIAYAGRLAASGATDDGTLLSRAVVALLAALEERTRERDEAVEKARQAATWAGAAIETSCDDTGALLAVLAEARALRGQVEEARGYLSGIIPTNDLHASSLRAALAALSREAPSPEPPKPCSHPEVATQGRDRCGFCGALLSPPHRPHVNRHGAGARAAAIVAGHSVQCAEWGTDAACPGPDDAAPISPRPLPPLLCRGDMSPEPTPEEMAASLAAEIGEEARAVFMSGCIVAIRAERARRGSR